MSFDKSPIRTAHCFRLTFIKLRYTSEITRQQIFFLSYLIENGHYKDFTVRSVMTNGLSWGLANQYLNSLKRIGYTQRKGHLWAITEVGFRYYDKFMYEFNTKHQEAFRWL